jgi:hypothetical protein
VILDLSVCIANRNTIGGTSEPRGNDMNIIYTNEFIKGLILPSTLISIGARAFYLCKYLASVTTIGVDAFDRDVRIIIK